MKTLIYPLIILALSTLTLKSFSQSQGSISGYVYNENDSLSVIGAHILIETGQKKYQAITDINGYFKIKPVEPGGYKITITFSGLDTFNMVGVSVTSGFDTDLKKIFMSSRTIIGCTIVWTEDMLDADGKNLIKVGPKELTSMPSGSDLKLALTYLATDYFVSERSQQVYFRGSREGSTAYYIDGMRVEDITMPGMGVGSMQIYAGGVPARFGDFTGGVVEIETKSYSDCQQERYIREQYLRLTEAPKTEPLKPEPQAPQPESEPSEM